MYFELASSAGVSRTNVDGVALFPYLGLFEGLGAFFGSVAELLPEEQTTLAGMILGSGVPWP